MSVWLDFITHIVINYKSIKSGAYKYLYKWISFCVSCIIHINLFILQKNKQNHLLLVTFPRLFTTHFIIIIIVCYCLWQVPSVSTCEDLQ